MTEVRTLFADPQAVFVDGEHGTWLVSGVATNRLRDLVATADGLREVSDALAARTEDAVVVFVSATERGGRVAAFRSATSSRDVFYLEASDGALVLTDHFRNAVSQLDVGDRTVDRGALADHLLFGSPVEPSTYVSEVGRLGRGERVRWDGVDSEWTHTVVDTLDPVERYSPATAVDELDDAFDDVLRVGVRPDARTMLSGGVDSALLASYGRNGPPPVQFALDAPECRPAVDAGREAADLLDATRETVTVPEASFLEHLEAAVDALGLPPRDDRTVVTAAGFRTLDAGQYVDSHGADGLFGLPGVRAARIADRLGPVVDAAVAERAAAAAGGRAADAYDELARRRRQLDRPTSSPESLAQTLATDPDGDAVADVFNGGVVRDRAQRRVEYATNRAPVDAESAFARQAAVGHLADYLGDDAANQRRQLGFAHGQDVVAPFRSRRVAETALAVPADRRYVSGVRGEPPLSRKHLPKRLLARRVGDYPDRHGAETGSPPIERYVEDGPLQSAFERYDPPAFLTPESYDAHVDSYGSLTWALLAYSVWRDRVLLEDDLDLVPGTVTRYLRLPQDPAAPPT